MLGPAIGEENDMVQYILKENGKVVQCIPTRALQVEGIHSTIEQKKRKNICRLVEGRWGTLLNTLPTSSNTKNETVFEEYSGDNEEAWVVADIEDSVVANGRLIGQKPAYENIMNAKVALQLD